MPAELVQAYREIQKVGRFFVNVDRTSGRGIDTGNDIPVEVAAEFILDSPGLRSNERREFEGVCTSRGFANKLARTSHSLESALPGVLGQVEPDVTLLFYALRSDSRTAQ